MQFTAKAINYIAFFFAIYLFSGQLFSQANDVIKPKGIFVSSNLWTYNSYSQQKMGYPLKAGYPVIQAQGVAVHGSYKFRRDSRIHAFSIESIAPVRLTSDNGTGQNHLLASNNLSYYKSIIGYKLWLNLFDFGKISVKQSFSSGVLYEYRKLNYVSGAIEKTSDINIYIGPCFQISYNVNQQWQIIGGFYAHFYLPYLNYGSLSTLYETGEQIFLSRYRAFYYQTNFSLGIRFKINNDLGIRIAFSKDDLVGFANRKPSFKINEIIHHKLDRVYALSVGVEF